MIRATPRHRRLLLAAALCCTPAFAADADFALAFPIEAPPGTPVFAFELPAEAYATLTTPDLTDLVVVDAQGREQPITLQRPPPPAPPVAPQVLALALPIAVPGDPTATPGGWELHVRRDAEGGLAALDLQSAEGGQTSAGAAEWLVDVGDESREGLDGLRLTPRDDADFRTLVDLRGSDDLVHWQPLQSALPLLRASGDGRRIERLDLRFPRSTHRYLALRPVPGEAPLPTVAVLEGLRRRDAEPAPLATRVLEAEAVSEDGRTFEFAAFGPVPVQQAEVRLADGDGIVDYRLEESIGDRWQTVASGTAWRLSMGGETLQAAPQPLWRSGTGRLRLHWLPSAPRPRLVVGYVPDRVIVMAQGTPPFRLLAGSAQGRRMAVTLGDPLAAVRQREGQDWQPPSATVGPAQTLAGPTALRPPADPGRWSLWAVLGLGALVVGVLAWRLLGSSPPSE